MKKPHCPVVLALWLSAVVAVAQNQPTPSSTAQTPPDPASKPVGDYQVIERDQDHKVWWRPTQLKFPDGSTAVSSNVFIEVGTGGSYQDANGWHDSVESVVPFPDGAVSTQLVYRVIFASDGSATNAIDMLTTDGQRLVSHAAALAYTDRATGQSVILSIASNTVGQIIGNNEVLYPNLFPGLGSVIYRVTKAGLEQFVLLEGNPPAPSSFGLANATSQLECWTEFVDWADPQPLATNVFSTGQTDVSLNFGAMRIGSGKAFLVPQATGALSVAKDWHLYTNSAGVVRAYLVESVDYTEANPALATLPPGSAQTSPPVKGRHPPTSYAQSRRRPLQLASSGTGKRKGFMVDYSILSSGSSLTLQGDTTYFVGSALILTNLVIEGGSVVKFTNSSANPSITLRGTITCNTSQWLPAIFTAQDDNSVGTPLPWGTNTISGYYANPAIDLNASSGPNQVSNVRVLYALEAFYDNANSTVLNAQVVNCGTAFALGPSCTENVWNALVFNTTNFCNGSSGGTLNAQQSTVDNTSYLVFGSGATLNFTNGVLANVTNSTGSGASVGGSHNGFYKAVEFGSSAVTNTSNPFQTSGLANHYLASGSSFLGVGTTNITPTLLAGLPLTTTTASSSLSGSTNGSVTLSPVVARDTNASPNLGYHYDPIDYLSSGYTVTNATLTLTNGVVVAVASGAAAAFWMTDGSRFNSQGTPLNHNVLTWDSNVGESPGSGLNSLIEPVNLSNANIAPPSVYCRFTDVPLINGQNMAFYSAPSAGSIVGSMYFQDCVFSQGWLYLGAGTGTNTIAFVNNLFQRVYFVIWDYPTVTFYNNLFRFGTFDSSLFSTNSPVATDNIFDNTTFVNTGYNWTNGWNAYINTSARLMPTNAHDIVLTNFSYQNGPLSAFYQPTNSFLFQAGSRTAAAAGLYQYTVSTNELKETNGTVSIGLHFVALNAFGQPVDTDGDGIPDYLENKAGNGVYTPGVDLSDWQNPDTAYDGVTDLAEWQAGQNPANPTNPPQVMMGWWRFNTNTWPGEEGQLPMQAMNVSSVPGVSGTALLVDAPYWQQAGVRYHDVEQLNGQAQLNFNLKCGSISMWVQPTWTSTNLGGNGPYYDYGRLFEAGYFQTNGGWFALMVDTNGNNLIFGASSNATVSYPVNYPVTAPISWTSNNWYQVVLTYSPSNSFIYVNGALAGSGTGVTNYYPNAATRAYGAVIGADGEMQEQLFAAIDELQTFNYPLSSAQVYSNYTTNNPTLDTDYDGVSDVEERLEGTNPNGA